MQRCLYQLTRALGPVHSHHMANPRNIASLTYGCLLKPLRPSLTSGCTKQLSQTKGIKTTLFNNQKHYISPLSSCGFHTTPQKLIMEDRSTKAVTVWSNLRELKSSPLPALTLGLSGLIPFVAAPAYIMSAGAYLPDIAFAQMAYGACILSFLGGVRWGFVIPEENPIHPDWVNLGYSVMPSLIAWGGLMVPAPLGHLTVVTGLGVAAYADMAMYGYPAWFKGLRFLLSFVAILSLWTTFMCYFVISHNEVKDSDMVKVSE